MKTIWKFPLKTSGEPIEMPGGAEILCVQTQFDQPCIWVLVDPEARKVARHFAIYGTGHPVDDRMNFNAYVGTFQIQGGSLVFHVFEVPRT